MFSEDQTPAMTGLPSQPDELRKRFAPAPRHGQGRNSLRRGHWTHSLDLVMNAPSSFTGEESERIAAELILPKIYKELRTLAAIQLRNESGYQTLQPTALVHEAWVRVSNDGAGDWKGDRHLLGVAAIVMRRILVERARGKATIKRTIPEPNESSASAGSVPNEDHLIMIHECLTKLEMSDPDSAKVVLLKFYGGFSNQEIAKSTGWSLRTVERQWMFAKAKLYRLIRESQNPATGRV